MQLFKNFLASPVAAQDFTPRIRVTDSHSPNPASSTNCLTPWSRMQAKGPGLTVLVVDDEPLIIEYVRHVLEQANYTVITSPSGTEAWGIIEQGQVGIDLLLTDIIMPGLMDGLTLATNVRQKYPMLPILFMTGALLEGNEYTAEIAVKRLLLRKPFLPKQLFEFIHSHLPFASPVS